MAGETNVSGVENFFYYFRTAIRGHNNTNRASVKLN